MALSGLEIYKKLPKTNCAKCGFPTCLAFAMQLAAGKVELDKCPDVTEEAKAALGEAAAPPIIPVTVGVGDGAVTVGEEMVLFRHEKRFEHPTVIAVLISDSEEPSNQSQKLKTIDKWSVERVGQTLSIDMVALKNESGNAEKFSSLVDLAKGSTEKPLILMTEKADVLKAAVEKVSDRKPLIYSATESNLSEFVQIAKDNSLPIAVKGEGVESVIELTTKLSELGLKEILIDTGSRKLGKALEDQIMIRRSALKKSFRPLGYSTIVFPCEMGDDGMTEAMVASTFIAKYGGIIVLSDIQPWMALPLLVLRQNIFTDPQRPMQMDEGIYPINNPDENSPLLITTNFSLTYFTVSNEVETSRVPTWLLVMDTEGLSVLTAWSAGKFVADAIAPFIKKSGISDKIKHRNAVIPGYVAQISGELEDELGEGWDVTVGVREAGDIPAFLKQLTA